MLPRRLAGRPRRFSRFEDFEAGLPGRTGKRPVYCDGVGIFKGSNVATAWVKIRLPRGGSYKGRDYQPGASIEIKIGNRSSWEWGDWLIERDRLQGLADRGEPLEAATVDSFADYAESWLERRKPSLKGYGVTRGHIKSALNPTFGKRALSEISVADINRWIGQRSDPQTGNGQTPVSHLQCNYERRGKERHH